MALGGVSVEEMDLVMGQSSSPGHDLPLNPHVCSSDHLSVMADLLSPESSYWQMKWGCGGHGNPCGLPKHLLGMVPEPTVTLSQGLVGVREDEVSGHRACFSVCHPDWAEKHKVQA